MTLVRVLLQVVIGQGRDFDAALAERRDVKPDDVETGEEVFAEPSLRDQGLEVCIGGSGDGQVRTGPTSLSTAAFAGPIRPPRRSENSDRAPSGHSDHLSVALSGQLSK